MKEKSLISNIKQSLIKLGRKNMEPDMVIEVYLCKIHRDYLTLGGRKVNKENLINILPLVRQCKECKVDIQ